MKMRKHYLNHCTGEDTASATQAMKWYRAGDLVQVNTYYNEPGKKTGLANVVHLQKEEAPRQERNAEKENRATCKHIAQEVEAYANGEYARCPECGEETRLPHSVGDKYKCPHCGEVVEYNDLEILGIWDYMSDILDMEYRVGSDRKYRSCRVMVAFGGPNIYIDTASRSVDLYWWNERATYLLSIDAADAIDEWAEEYWNI